MIYTTDRKLYFMNEALLSGATLANGKRLAYRDMIVWSRDVDTSDRKSCYFPGIVDNSVC